MFDASRYAGLIAQVGVIGVAIVSAVVNFAFWQSRGDLGAAWLTLFAELIALGGFVLVIQHWNRNRLTAIGGLLVTALSGGWGALTMTERLADEAHQRAVAAVETTPAFAQASHDLSLASSLYAGALMERVPDGLGPLTTEQRSLDLQRRRDALKAERDQAQARLVAITPTPALDLKSIARGWGAMLAVLLGLSVFGFRHTREIEIRRPEHEPKPALTPADLGRLGAAARKAKREAKEQKRLARNAYMRSYRAKQSGKADLWDAGLFGQLPN